MIKIVQSTTYNFAQLEYSSEQERFFIENLRESTKVKNPGAKYTQFANKFNYIITPLYKFRTYLAEHIYDLLMEYTPDVEIDEALMKILRPLNLELKYEVPNTKFKLRDYQKEGSEALLKTGRGIIIASTGVGKSLIIATVFHNVIKQNSLQKNEICLLLVPTCALVIQMYSDMLDYGMPSEDIQQFSSKYKTIEDNKKIIITNRDWITRHYEDISQKYKIKILFVDEVHTLNNNKISKFIEKLMLPIVFGCTGTLSNNSKDSEWYIQGIVGPIRMTKKIVEMQEQGYIAKINIRHIKLMHDQIPVFPRDTYEDIKLAYKYEYEWINENKASIKVIANILQKLKGNTIVLFKHIVHGRNIFKETQSNNKHLIEGGVDVEIRDSVREIAENTNNCIIIGNFQCISTGINIKNIQNIVFVGGGKSLIGVIQSIGRGLRLLKGKTHLNLIDITHNLKYSTDHYKSRKIIYMEDYNKKNIKEIELFLK